MGNVWFWLVTFMLSAYVVLDGFDIGVGILQPLIGRNSEERGALLETIRPVWDANEVWLIAAGATLLFAFPLLYGLAFSGFYLALNILLVAAGVPRYRSRTAHASHSAAVARVLRWMLCLGEYAPRTLLRRRSCERYQRRWNESRQPLLPAALDRSPARPVTRNPRLVHHPSWLTCSR